MSVSRFFRYLAPNLITLSSMIFGLVSLWASHTGDHSLAAWLIIYAVLTDRLDGLVARAVKGTSELGMQLDSFADMLNFGVAPPFLVGKASAGLVETLVGQPVVAGVLRPDRRHPPSLAGGGGNPTGKIADQRGHHCASHAVGPDDMGLAVGQQDGEGDRTHHGNLQRLKER